MSRLEDLQNKIAIEKGFEDFDHLLENTHEMELIKSYFNKASIRYAREVAQASLDRAGNEVPYESPNEEMVLKSIITNPDNIVLI